MKVYIMTDMEGVAGVLSADDYTDQASRYYEAGRELTTLEVSAAVQGCLDEGATEVLVVDGHGSGAIALRLLHPAATLLAGRPLGYPFGCDETFVAAMMVGQHAKSNTDGGHLSHTGSFAVDELTINGVSVGEMGCNMLFCAHFGVPVVLVTGDEAAAAEAHALVPEIETVAVKSGVRWGPASGLTPEQNKLHNGGAVHLHPDRARAEIRHKAARALARHREIPPYRLEPPYELVEVLRPTAEAPARTARVQAQDILELLNAPRSYR